MLDTFFEHLGGERVSVLLQVYQTGLRITIILVLAWLLLRLSNKGIRMLRVCREHQRLARLGVLEANAPQMLGVFPGRVVAMEHHALIADHAGTAVCGMRVHGRCASRAGSTHWPASNEPVPALFLKMFGDPATNPMGWPEMPLSKVIKTVEAGWSAASEGRSREDGEFGVLKVSAVTSGIFRPEENKPVTQIDAQRSLISPKRGDLLFSRANTRELVAASCVVESDYPYLFLPDKIWRLSPVTGEASTFFLKELFWRDGFRDKFRAVSSGSSGSMLNISQDAMLRTVAPIPPFERQARFERLAWSVMDNIAQANNAAQRIEATWTNLLQRAFSGQLTAQWREAHMKELLAEMAQQARALDLPVEATS